MTMSEVEHVLLSELLQWYTLQRHDYMNHWQVIMGNLQLDQQEKALAYMRESVVLQEQEQKLAFLQETTLAAILLGLFIGLRQEGITMTFDFPETMKKKEFWTDHWRVEYAEGLYGYTKECLQVSAQYSLLSNVTAEVYLFEEQGGLACQVILENEETVFFDKLVKLAINVEYQTVI